MNYFLVGILLKYDGKEWRDFALIEANNREEAIAKTMETDFTHGLPETQEVYRTTVITKDEYITLKRLL